MTWASLCWTTTRVTGNSSSRPLPPPSLQMLLALTKQGESETWKDTPHEVTLEESLPSGRAREASVLVGGCKRLPQRPDSAFVCGTWPHSQPVTSPHVAWEVSKRLCTHLGQSSPSLPLHTHTCFWKWTPASVSAGSLLTSRKTLLPDMPARRGSGPMCQ